MLICSQYFYIALMQQKKKKLFQIIYIKQMILLLYVSPMQACVFTWLQTTHCIIQSVACCIQTICCTVGTYTGNISWSFPFIHIDLAYVCLRYVRVIKLPYLYTEKVYNITVYIFHLLETYAKVETYSSIHLSIRSF